MKNLFSAGDIRIYRKIVELVDTAEFETGQVHPVYATFALGRDAEWCTRLFVLDMKEPDEEGIGTFLSVQHCSPALIGEEVLFTGKVESIDGNELICTYEARVGDRLVANGETGQKILKKEKIERLLRGLKNG